jgi:endonuclease III
MDGMLRLDSLHRRQAARVHGTAKSLCREMNATNPRDRPSLTSQPFV